MRHPHINPVRSERDAAWFEEVAAAVARGAAALAEEAVTAEGAALALLATADAGTPAEPLARALAEPEPADDLGAAALALTALARSRFALRQWCLATVHAALNRLLAVQNRDGGWTAAERGPSCPLATARALEALGHFGFRVGQPVAAAGVRFLLARQDQDGGWSDVATTGAALLGLCAVGFDRYAMPLRRAVRWLNELQNGDGDWGGAPSETGCAVLALLAAGEGDGPEVRAGAEFLLGTQRASGTWAGAGALPLAALGRYLADRTAPPEPAVACRDLGHALTGPRSRRHTLAEM